MSERENTNSGSSTYDIEQDKHSYFPEHINNIFKRLDSQDVEQFYKSYQFWSLQQRIEILQLEIESVQQAIRDNDELLQQVRPSAIALASLAQIQARGINDRDLLDRMLARGEDWLDYIMQVLRHCEELDVIGGDYTQWCEHALEGAYDWIASMNGIENGARVAPESSTLIDNQATDLDAATEEQLLQKLMSEGEETEKLAAIGDQCKKDEIVSTNDELPTATEHMLITDEIVSVPETPVPDEATEPEPDALAGPVSEQRQEGDNLPAMKMPALNRAKITRKLAVVTEQTESNVDTVSSPEDIEIVHGASSPQECSPVSQADFVYSSISRQRQKELQAPNLRSRGFWGILRRLLKKTLRS